LLRFSARRVRGALVTLQAMTTRLSLRRPPWPLPAIGGWLLAWGVFAACGSAALAALAGAAVALAARGAWRRLLVAGGFPLSLLALGGLPSVPAWAWLAATAPLLLAYPLRAWRDAPFFPTPAHALDALPQALKLPPGARVLDAGCGLGHGLAALHRAWPQVALAGIEWSRPLAWLAARRCRYARIERGDMWAASWAGVDLVYLFQRPESMARAWRKAQGEMDPGSWLLSLEFEVPGQMPQARLAADASGRPLWLYRIDGISDSIVGHGRR
jgi:hypothetical protein